MYGALTDIEKEIAAKGINYSVLLEEIVELERKLFQVTSHVFHLRKIGSLDLIDNEFELIRDLSAELVEKTKELKDFKYV